MYSHDDFIEYTAKDRLNMLFTVMIGMIFQEWKSCQKRICNSLYTQMIQW